MAMSLPKVSLPDPQSGMVAIPWASENNALTRHLLTTINEHLNIRLSLWRRLDDPAFITSNPSNLTKGAASVRLAELVFNDGVAAGKHFKASRYAKAIRSKMLNLFRGYMELKSWAADPEYQGPGPGLARFLEKRAKMEPYLDLLCILNGDSVAEFGITNDAAPEVEILRPPFSTSQGVVDSLESLPTSEGVIMEAEKIDRSVCSNGGEGARDEAGNSAKGEVGNGYGGESQTQESDTQGKAPVTNEPWSGQLSQTGHESTPKETPDTEAINQEGEILGKIHAIKSSSPGTTPPSIGSSLGAEEIVSSDRTTKHTGLQQESQGMYQSTEGNCQFGVSLPVTDGFESLNEASLTPASVKRPHSEGDKEAEELREAREHERYMINARIRLAEAEIFLARINKGLVKQ